MTQNELTPRKLYSEPQTRFTLLRPWECLSASTTLQDLDDNLIYDEEF